MSQREVIVCVEDEAAIRLDLVEELSDAGYQVHEAGDGDEALAVIARVRPALVICDINMPHLSGLDVLERLRDCEDERAELPFIFLTAYGDRDNELRGRRLGADDYLVKPVDFDILLATVEARLRNTRRVRERAEARVAELEQRIARLRENVEAPPAAPSAELSLVRYIESSVNTALAAGEFTLHLQPKLRLKDNRLIGAEALLRWNSAAHGPLSPALFIPILERSGLMARVSDWVLQETARLVQVLGSAGIELPVAFNASAADLRGDFSERVRQALERHALGPQRVEVEVTETSVIGDCGSAAAALASLRALGIAVSVDDFGTGYSTLAYLRAFPLDVLKIDRSFITGLTDNPVDRQIVDSVITLARALGLHTVAEGVETEQQLEALRALGCDSVQGYLIARPLPIEAFIAFVRGWTP